MGNKTREDLKDHTSDFFRPMGKAYIPSSTASVPLLSLLNHLFIYFFLPLERKTVAFAFGCTTSCICMALNLGIELSSWSQVSIILKDEALYMSNSPLEILLLPPGGGNRFRTIWIQAKSPLNLLPTLCFMPL